MAKDYNEQTNTIVGPNTVIHGNLNVKGSVLIYGTVLGDVRSDGSVRTAKDSLIKGSLVSRDAIIDGELEGSLTTKGRATLGSTALFVGELRAALLVVEEGARFSGKCQMEGVAVRKVPLRAKSAGGDGASIEKVVTTSILTE